MSKKKRAKQWPPIYRQPNRNGQRTYYVDLRAVGGGRPGFSTEQEAQTRAEQARIQKANDGTAAFSLPTDVRIDAAKANQILSPHGVSILEAAKYYEKHVLAYKSAPTTGEIVKRYLADCLNRNLRDRTIGDYRHRLNTFAIDFGDSRLSEVSLEELKEWIQDDGWGMLTRNHFLTKISQLYNFAVLNNWADANLTQKIARPKVDETPIEIFNVDEAERLLASAQEFDLLPYFAIGFFGGVRSAEMFRLNSRSINFEAKTITIGADIAKRRSQRIIDMLPALLAWLERSKEMLQSGCAVVDQKKFRKNKEQLLEAAEIQNWRVNGLRHSFGTYHYAMFRSAEDTSHQMGNSPNVVHKHYKKPVAKSEAERFWNLRPKPAKPALKPSTSEQPTAASIEPGAASEPLPSAAP